MLRSLRSRLIVASLLWTTGLLMNLHMLSVMFFHVFPRFRGHEALAPLVASLFLMAGGFDAARRTLTPFRSLREKLNAVRDGRERRVAGEYPTEVQPLIDDLNALLEDREKAVDRAFASAGDLAHGLKTPLALISQEAAQSPAIAQQVDRMSRQISYHLARARAAASGSAGAAPCAVAPCVEALIRTMEKLHASRSVTLSANIPGDFAVRVQRQDLDELLGNLLDNACKWARSRVVIAATATTITVDDDGPGLAPALRTAVLERGVRADQAAPGSGLGLAIVRDLIELYGGAIRLEDSPLGGLRATITFR